MLHHYVRADIQEVVTELQEAGYPFEMAWLDPFFEFRFPKLGTVQVGDIEIELRMGIEPWHVLGEEVSPEQEPHVSLIRLSNGSKCGYVD